ncbi:hypothetical protein LXL04_005066 [Taraxacum kok-saghyz]
MVVVVVVGGGANGGNRCALNSLFAGYVSVPRARASPLSLAYLFLDCSRSSFKRYNTASHFFLNGCWRNGSQRVYRALCPEGPRFESLELPRHIDHPVSHSGLHGPHAASYLAAEQGKIPTCCVSQDRNPDLRPTQDYNPRKAKELCPAGRGANGLGFAPFQKGMYELLKGGTNKQWYWLVLKGRSKSGPGEQRRLNEIVGNRPAATPRTNFTARERNGVEKASGKLQRPEYAAEIFELFYANVGKWTNRVTGKRVTGFNVDEGHG